MCKHGTDVIMEPPDYIRKDRINQGPVVIDACIAHYIEKLWAEKIHTQSCCCGHRKNPGMLMVGEKYDSDEIQEIYDMLESINKDHGLKICQWQCVDVPRVPEGD